MDIDPRTLERARAQWRHRGEERPPFAEPTGPGEESVWDYPRPPRIEPDPREVRVVHGPHLIAETTRAVRVLETASPPTFYLPSEEVDTRLLEPQGGGSFCEWKGRAAYFAVVTPAGRLDHVAWAYPDPFPEFAAIAGFLAFYPDRLVCTVAGARAQPQPGGLYGGWITPELRGPFKGGAGTAGW